MNGNGGNWTARLADESHRRALTNLNGAIDGRLRFPQNVFALGWNEFVFFDPDRIFDRKFVGVAQVILETEGGICACMSNLDLAGRGERSLLFIERGMSPEAYVSFLQGPSKAEGWVLRMDRYASASDVGQWCMYWERDNELAVMAFREHGMLKDFEPAIRRLGALPIEKALAEPPSYSLSQQGSPPVWRNTLLQQYAKRSV
jgi:hypothetical protein